MPLRNHSEDSRPSGSAPGVLPDTMLPTHDQRIRNAAEPGLIQKWQGDHLNSQRQYTSPERDVSDASQQATEKTLCADRAELIERIKRGESPTWVPNQAFQEEYMRLNGVPFQSSPSREQRVPSALLPAADFAKDEPIVANEVRLHSPYEVERPRSALHAGDFTEEPGLQANPQRALNYDAAAKLEHHKSKRLAHLGGAHSHAPSSMGPYEERVSWGDDRPSSLVQQPWMQRASSVNQYSSNYIHKVPTTPLVQQSNDVDLGLVGKRSVDPDKAGRCHTLPPHAMLDWHSSQIDQGFSYRRSSPPPGPLLGTAGVTRGHHARRSITLSWSLQHPPSPPIPGFLRSRQTSISSEASPRQRASMVGSYEESIIRGRMSTAPSKPFDFTAHIGALGRGKIPKMPAHVIVPFQAVFYDWSSNHAKGAVADEPSPYVGHIDLQNIREPLEATESDIGIDNTVIISPKQSSQDRTISSERHFDAPSMKLRKRRRISDLATVPRGSYRIPERGQIQVVIKNPYKTALKLFLVPYDLTGMEPGQKTFVRQRYYSAGPILERPVPPSLAPPLEDSKEPSKPILRYLIHLNICCSAKGHFHLFQNIRVVFANRVPDDKEHLSKDLQEPHPKYNFWKPSLDSFAPSTFGPTDNIARRRRSSDFTSNGSIAAAPRSHLHIGGPHSHADADNPPVPSIPFYRPRALMYDSALRSGHAMKIEMLHASPDMSSPSAEWAAGTEGHVSSDSGDSDIFVKLSQGDPGYGGAFGRPSNPETGQGLLAHRLRVLNVRTEASRNVHDPQVREYY